MVPPAWAGGQAGRQEGAWPGQPLSSLPALHTLRLEGCFSCSDALLGDLAGCSGLRGLKLKPELGPGIGGAGLAVLAAGASAASLEELCLRVDRAALEEGQLAQLVARRRSRPRWLTCIVSASSSGRGLTPYQELQKLPEQQLREEGAAVGLSCTVLREGWGFY